MRYEELAVPSEEPLRPHLASELADRLRAGGILVHPTSTLYGLGAKADPDSDGELARLKGRSADMPLIRLAGSVAAVRGADPPPVWDDRAARLADAFWPGPLTIVLDDATERGLAVRVDPHPVVRAVLRAFGGLMSSTSVNRSGAPPATGPEEVRRELRVLPESSNQVTFLNVGALPPSAPSTVVSLRHGAPRLLRAGAVAAERISSYLDRPLLEAS